MIQIIFWSMIILLALASCLTRMGLPTILLLAYWVFARVAWWAFTITMKTIKIKNLLRNFCWNQALLWFLRRMRTKKSCIASKTEIASRSYLIKIWFARKWATGKKAEWERLSLIIGMKLRTKLNKALLKGIKLWIWQEKGGFLLLSDMCFLNTKT